MNAKTEQAILLTEDSVSAQSHLQILQAIIHRMAANSTSCKAWSITIVSAILVLIADKGKPNLALLAFLPTLLFLLLDAYYLAHEKAFRASYNLFVRKLHSNKLQLEDLFSVTPHGNMTSHQVEALKSYSVWGFYGALAILVVVTKLVVLTQ